ncbi:hypothetical protein [uncultured Tenacibaculum sp.]|uniref:hypothetical protein n=1 Tax=uncultured Tenacibaculum sp. TaxID=174713 RepID=UPI00260DCB82|nr:hypothetical protein [uncultured Tenacibaculum sp.]
MKKRFTLKKKYILTVVLFCVSITNVAADAPEYFCGGWYYDPDSYYYNLFNQENISQKAFYPFLRTELNPFYADQPLKDSKNIDEWYVFFDKKYNKEALTETIYGKENKARLIKGNTAKEISAKRYLDFAKSCEKVTVNKERYYWDYDALIKKRKQNAPSFISKGLALYSKEKNIEIKLRYAYQIIRLYRYNYEFLSAIEFFNNEVKPIAKKNEIYYYILDQIAGCYYKLKNYEKAAYLFLKVFDKSIDRKRSSFTSYLFCTYHNAEGKTLLKTKEEKANQIFITAIRNFSDTMQDLEKITALGLAEDKQELLVIRIINNLERSILNVDFRQSIFQKKDEVGEQLSDLQNFIERKVRTTSKNKEFWELTDAYLSFLNQDFEIASEKLGLVRTEKLTAQKESLLKIFEVFSWTEITEEREIWLAKMFKGNSKGITMLGSCSEDGNEKKLTCNLRGIILEQVSHLYLKEGKIAQAYLLHNYISGLRSITSHKLVDSVTEFIQKEDKNTFEKLLLRQEGKQISKESLLAIANDAKGLMYFRSGDFNKALPYFSTNSKEEIPNTVFSNNTIECFNCPPSMVMEDEVYKASAYTFIQNKMNTYELLENLQELDRMANDETVKQWKRKLANYLLGNYFFNVSNTGYYRTVVYPGRSYEYNYDFGSVRPNINNVLNNKSTYSFPNGGYDNTYNGLAKKAIAYYQKTIEMSTDNELNARCAYMIAKCELNEFYNVEKDNRYSDHEGSQQKFKSSGFDALKTKYRTTNFYEKIRSKCSYFRHYNNN